MDAMKAGTLKNQKLITCILMKGRVMELVKRLHEEKGMNMTNVTSARGIGVVESISYAVWKEVDVLTVVVGEAMADEVFEFLYRESKIADGEKGFMYQGALLLSTPFVLPDLPEE